MNIQEAIKSGKRFRRLHWDSEHWCSSNYYLDVQKLEKDRFLLTISDIIADDWQIEEEKIEITREQLRQALSGEFLMIGLNKITFLLPQIERKLGFKS